MRFLFLLPLALLATGCNAPDDTGANDTTVIDDGGTNDPIVDPGFSATIVAERPAFMPVFQLQPADDDQAPKTPMSCGGNNVCTAELDEPGNWRLWGTADGWMITYNKVVSVTEDGERAEVTLDQFGDYGVDLSGLVYEDEDGERYEVETTYVDGKVVLTGLARSGPMLGYDFGGPSGDVGYTIVGTISEDLEVITIDMVEDASSESIDSISYTLVE